MTLTTRLTLARLARLAATEEAEQRESDQRAYTAACESAGLPAQLAPYTLARVPEQRRGAA